MSTLFLLAANVRTKNVILFGETGVGKSSIINLMAGSKVAQVSPNLRAGTLESTEHPFLLAGEMPLLIYDTVGLNEPEIGPEAFLGAVHKAHLLIKTLHARGGVDLLLFCIRGNRITGTMQRNYHLFFDILGDKKVPLAFVVTNLDNEEVMEHWWRRNEPVLQDYDMRYVAHACTTAGPARLYARKREESRSALQRMFHEAFSNPTVPGVQDVRTWLDRVIEFFYSLLRKNSWYRKRELSQKLEDLCGFSRDEGRRLARMLVGGGWFW